MKDGKKLVYSGDSLRRFLHRKGLTYKDAAKELGLDKNTIGKAVRGGNMNINVLLSIANHWNFPITDFFIFVNQEECEETYFISPNKYNNNSANDNLLVSEDSKIYKNIKNLLTEELALKASKQQEISLLQNLMLTPVLGITDPKTDPRIDFVGGIRGLGELKKRVDSGEMKVALALYPVSMKQLMDIADTGNIMPPKTTWFEPKLRSGLVIHKLD